MAVHLQNAGDPRVAVDWPNWADRPGGFGHKTRLFGSFEAISSVLILLHAYRDAELISWDVIKPVPENAFTRWAFIRARQYKKTSGSYWRRLLKRHPELAEQSIERPVVKFSHSFPIQSFSSKQSFKLKIQRVEASQLTNGMTSYGLSVAIPSWD